MAKTFKVLSALLSYPTPELQEAVPEMTGVLNTENLLPRRTRRALDSLLREIATGDLYDLQERYILLFDRTRSLSLYLFEHVHGESRDRGQAMIDLKSVYEQAGLAPVPSELPDFLPLFLEYLSTLSFVAAKELLAEPAHILAALAERLRKRDSSYEAPIRALLDIAEASTKPEHTEALLSEPEVDPTDLEALDRAWEDAAVTFGPSAGNACKDEIIARVRAAKRPASAHDTDGATHA